MKITLLTILLSTITIFNHVQAQVQEWQSIASFPGDGRTSAVQFVIGDTAYVGLGVERDTYNYYKKDFYKYDIQNDLWTPISDFPGAARSSAVAFVVNGKAYVGTGGDDSNSYADFYKYDPNTGSWESVASMPNVRSSASSFVINNKGYVGLGSGSSGQLSDFYKYDDHNDQWVSISGVGDEFKRTGAIGFNVNGKGYISSGVEYSSGTFNYQDILSYDPTTDTWTEELGYDINLSSLMDNTVYVDENNLVHVLKAASTNKEVIIDVTDFSVSSEEYYFTDDRDDPIVFQINGEVISGLGATGNIFDPIYQNSFQKLVTITIDPPKAPTLTETIPTWDGVEEFNILYWENNEKEEFDNYIIYLSKEDNESYRSIGTVESFKTSTKIYNYLLDPNTIHYVKIAANRKGVTSTSNELSFYPIFREGKINTPEILAFNSSDDFKERELEIYNFDNSEKVIIEKSVNNQDYQIIDTSQYLLQSRNTTAFSFIDQEDSVVSELKYRVKLIDDEGKRIASDFSNEFIVNLDSLKPSIDSLKLRSFDVYSSSIDVNLDTKGIKNRQYFVLQYKFENDSTFGNSDTLRTTYFTGFNTSSELDSIKVRLIVSNLYGADTSNVISVFTPLLSPNSLKLNYTSENTIGLEFDNRSRIKEGVIIERKVNNGEFILYDTLSEDSWKYFDEKVESGNSYTYRVYNFNDNNTSKASNEITAKAVNMGVWKKYNGDGLESILDSMGLITNEYKLINDSSIYFLSVSSKKLHRYNLYDSTLKKLNDLPADSLMRFNDVIYHQDIIYGWGAQNYNYDYYSTIYRYNVNENKWDTSLDMPYEDYEVRISHVVDDKIFLIMQNPGGYLEIANYDINSESWDKNEYDEQYVYPTYITHSNDSLIFFTENAGRISYNFSTKEISIEDVFINYESRFFTQLSVVFDDKLIHLNNNSIDELNVNTKPYLTKIEYLPIPQNNSAYAFTYNDKLFYGLSLGRSRYNSTDQKWYRETESLYYKDEDAILPAVNLKADSIGIEGVKLSWIDSPNEDNYYIEIESFDSIYYSDTLAQNTNFLTVNSLPAEKLFTVTLFSMKDGTEGNSLKTFFRTKQGRPNRPTGFSSKAISSSEILYTWDPIDTTLIPVDSLVFIDYNARKYNLNLADTSFFYAGLEENSNPAVDLYVKNEYGSASAWWNDRARTYLNSPMIDKVNIHETAGYYEIIFEDKSEHENHYLVYRKSEQDTAFIKLDSVSTSQYEIEEENLSYEDQSADLNANYQYYLKAMLKVERVFSDTTLYEYRYSIPSDTLSTENAVLSVNPYLDAEISIYPNPANEFVNFSLGENIILKQIQVLNVNGKFVKTVKSNDRIDLSNLAPGLYFVRFKTNQGETTKKLIKR
ncbi:Kelch repeat-containing protein [Marivirga arenosa]|uniref:T9SS type A sorting domain-containing protein n=1 Tax=Marivirga arenosa TaxID=3059076 RepID=A0AA51X3V4_9BACT|nr:T9SS type A sorting domain-containing protein [Marivirga sp. BKB1-2]WNB17004.1 T9SS type A sorting domain-containing protein [Marivirga sp. BKB1-2]